MHFALFVLQEKGWTLAKLANTCDIDPADVVRFHKEAAKSFALFRSVFPDGKWPMVEVPVEVLERKPKGHEDEVIVFKPFSGPAGKVYADWRSLAPTFIDDGNWKVVRSGKPALAKKAYASAFACARKTPGISAICVDDPERLFPPEARPKLK